MSDDDDENEPDAVARATRNVVDLEVRSSMADGYTIITRSDIAILYRNVCR